MDKQTFLKSIKTKYPEYENIDDETLYNKIIEKYPVYKSQIKEPTFGGQVIRESIKPFAKLGTSLVNIGQIATGNEVTQPFSGKYLGEVKPIGEGFDVTKGFTKENIGALKDSLKTGVDIGLWFGGGGGAKTAVTSSLKDGLKAGFKEGVRTGATVGGVAGASTGLEEDATAWNTLKNTVLGTGVGVIGGGVLGAVPGAISGTTKAVKAGVPKIAKGTGQAVEAKVPKLLSIFTGEDNEIVKTAMAFPDIADKGIMGGDEALRKAVTTGAESSIRARSDFSKAYNDAFAKLVEKNPNKLVSRQNILYNFVDDLEKAGVKVKNGELDFSTSLINANPGEATKIKNAYEALMNWDDWSLEGTNLYKQLVGKLTKFPTEVGGTSKSPFLGKFYNFVDTEIKNNLPEVDKNLYSDMNKKFSSSIEMYDDMVDAFNSGDPFTKLAGIFGKNKDTLRRVVDFYEKTTGEKISPIVAGRQLAEEKPAAFGFLNPRQWIDFFVAPETQAKIVTTTGRKLQSLKKNANKPIETTGINMANPQIIKTNANNVIKPIIQSSKNKVNTIVKPKKARVFSDIHKDDQQFLLNFVSQVKNKKPISNNLINRVRETLKSYGFNSPNAKTKIANFIETASNSSDEKQMFNLLDKNLKLKK